MHSEIETVGTAFGLPGTFVGAKPYGTGHINDTYVATYRQGETTALYTVQRINCTVFADPHALMDNIERVSRHLVERLGDVPDAPRRALHLLQTPAGAPLWVDARTGHWRIYRFIDEAYTVDIVGCPQQAYEAAQTAGTFQRLLSDYQGPRLHETIPDFHHTPARLAAFERVLRADPAGRARAAAAEIDFVRRRGELAQRLVQQRDAGLMRERITHNDTKINNVLIDQQSGKGLCMIDLDTVMPGLALYDFGDLIRTSVSPGAEDTLALDEVGVRLPYVQALTEGYLSKMADALSPAETQSLGLSGQVITFEIGLRFLTDHLAGDVYFKTHRPNHNLDRCRTQFRLVAELEAREAEIEAIISRG